MLIVIGVVVDVVDVDVDWFWIESVSEARDISAVVFERSNNYFLKYH